MKEVKRFTKVLLGCLIIGITINLFFVDINLVPSGIFGFAVLYADRVPIHLALVILLVNLFVFILGILVLDKKIFEKTFLPFLLIPLFVFVTEKIGTLIEISYAEPLLLALYGGALIGIGYTLIYKSHMYASGSDVISQICREVFGARGNIINYVFDCLWIVFAVVMYGLEMAMYSIIAIILIELISKKATIGISDSKAFYIITKKEREVKKYIIEDLHHDLTIFDVKGGFSKSKNKILMTVISTSEYYVLREGIMEIDPEAFISITDSYEVINKNVAISNR